MKTMTFQARELREALAQVRRKLGPDALIVSTREVQPVLGLGKPLLEVTAALPGPVAPARPPAPPPPAAGRAVEEPPPRRLGPVSRLLNRVGGGPSLRLDPADQDEEEIARRPRPPHEQPSPPREERAVGGGSSGSAGRGGTGTSPPDSEAEAALQRRLQPLQREVRALRSQLYQVAQGQGPALKQEVEELRQVLKTMGVTAQKTGEITPEVARLINLGIERPRAEALVLRARELGGEQALYRAVAERVAAAGPVGVSARVAAFVGPTGVGKTTTIAKIAARAALIDGARVSLITIDTFRVGAIDQLQRYADLMELPLHVAGTSAALRAAVVGNSGADLILVDTAGRGPRDVAQLAALRELLGSADGVEVHLCLSATTRSREQALALQSYRALQPSRLCVTKLDEAIGLGEILNLHESARLPLSYFGTGQRVPEDLELCTPEGFADRLLSAVPAPDGGDA